MSKLSQLYYMSNHEWRMALKPLGIAALVLFVLDLAAGLASATAFTDFDPSIPVMPIRFEQFVSGGGLIVFHLLAVVFVLGYTAYTWQRLFSPFRSIDRYYQMPLGAGAVFLAKVALGILLMLAIQVIQLLSLIIIYYIAYLPATGVYGMRQGLFLAFSRSFYLRLLLPAGIPETVFIILAMLLLVSASLTLVNLARYTDKRKTFFLAGVIIIALAAWSLSPASSSLASTRTELFRIFMQLPAAILAALLMLINLRWLRRRLLS